MQQNEGVMHIVVEHNVHFRLNEILFRLHTFLNSHFVRFPNAECKYKCMECACTSVLFMLCLDSVAICVVIVVVGCAMLA